MEQIIVRCINLPCAVKGFVREDENGDYNIYINARLSYDTQTKALRHELRHVKRDDFYSDAGIEDVEG